MHTCSACIPLFRKRCLRYRPPYAKGCSLLPLLLSLGAKSRTCRGLCLPVHACRLRTRRMREKQVVGGLLSHLTPWPGSGRAKATLADLATPNTTDMMGKVGVCRFEQVASKVCQ